jgi:hypothetical protein
MLSKKSVNQCHQWSSLNFTHAVQNPWQSPLVLFVTFVVSSSQFDVKSNKPRRGLQKARRWAMGSAPRVTTHVSKQDHGGNST